MIFKFQINIKINIILLAATFVFAQVFQALAFNNVTYATCPTSEIRYKCRDCIKTRIDDSSRSGGTKRLSFKDSTGDACKYKTSLINYYT